MRVTPGAPRGPCERKPGRCRPTALGLPGVAGSALDKFAIALVAIAVCFYVAWVQIDCARDPHCHMNWCGKRPCGMSWDKPGAK